MSGRDGLADTATMGLLPVRTSAVNGRFDAVYAMVNAGFGSIAVGTTFSVRYLKQKGKAPPERPGPYSVLLQCNLPLGKEGPG